MSSVHMDLLYAGFHYDCRQIHTPISYTLQAKCSQIHLQRGTDIHRSIETHKWVFLFLTLSISLSPFPSLSIPLSLSLFLSLTTPLSLSTPLSQMRSYLICQFSQPMRLQQ